MQINRIWFLILSFCLVLLTSCGNSDNVSVEEKIDSTTVLVGVYPSLDAVPMALAEDMGVLDSLGVKVKIVNYKSQLDAEEALAAGRLDVAMSDMFRVGWWQSLKKPVRFMFATMRPLYVVPNKVLRVTKIGQLDDRMIAVTRHSLDDYYCDQVVSLITKRKGQILRPQINDVELRLGMLTSGQLDAALLTSLQAKKALMAGYASLSLDLKSPEGFAGFACNTNSLKKKGADIKKLESAYNIVVGRLRKNVSLPEINEATAKGLGVDTVARKQINCTKEFEFSASPSADNVATAVTWLKGRSAVGPNYTGDTLAVK